MSVSSSSITLPSSKKLKTIKRNKTTPVTWPQSEQDTLLTDEAIQHLVFYITRENRADQKWHSCTWVAYFISLCPHTFLDKPSRSLAYFSSIEALKEKAALKKGYTQRRYRDVDFHARLEDKQHFISICFST